MPVQVNNNIIILVIDKDKHTCSNTFMPDKFIAYYLPDDVKGKCKIIVILKPNTQLLTKEIQIGLP